MREGVFKHFSKFTQKTAVVESVNFVTFLRIPFFIEHLQDTSSQFSNLTFPEQLKKTRDKP